MRANNVGGTLTVMKKDSIADGIQAVRSMIDDLWVDPKCKYIISCIQNYSKEWDDKLQQWKQSPLHDEYSHGADVLRGIAQNMPTSNSRNRSKYSTDSSYRGQNSGYDL